MANIETIIGAHAILYSRNAEADRSFLRDVLNFPHVDAGHGCAPPTHFTTEASGATLARASLRS